MKRLDRRSVLALAATTCGAGIANAQTERAEALTPLASSSVPLAQNPVAFWNEVALELCALDHSLPIPDPTAMAKDLPIRAPGPCATARALGLIHIVIADAVKSCYRNVHYNAFLKSEPATDVDVPALYVGGAAAAILHHIYDTGVHAFHIDLRRQNFLRAYGRDHLDDWARGWKFGNDPIFKSRWTWLDIWDRIKPIAGNYSPPSRGHNTDPFNSCQGFYGQTWGGQPPLVLTGGEVTGTCAPLAPPNEGSPKYEEHLAEVRVLGALKGMPDNPTRTHDQERIGVFWAYDGPRLIGTPPRLYNQIIREIAADDGLTVQELARLLALCNVAMADAGIVAWQAKYQYKVWRPVLGIQKHATSPDPNWKPLGAPKTNRDDFQLGTALHSGLSAQSLLGGGRASIAPTAAVATCTLDKAAFTPNFPAYPSGHATFGAACFDMLRRVRAEKLRRVQDADKIQLRFVSDELDGFSVDNFRDVLRPLRRTHFDSIEDMIQANDISRIHLGVHWRFDADGGDASGRKIAETVHARAYPRI